MSGEYDPSIVSAWIAGGSVSIVSALAFAREWMKSRSLTDINRDAAINGVEINNGVLGNLQKEMIRLTARVAELENKLAAVTDTLVSIRLIALDCYQIANSCACETRHQLMDRLTQIIKDA